ncbi:hypothetical protein [Candidatus Electronema sp. JM]|uniref:hypothetical protein n=1 Tax=Candidatus Electronema sp. JM TaxID=3401571 RepID=UPI003AA8C33A
MKEKISMLSFRLEKELEKLGLTEDQISIKNLSDLNSSLDKINNVIINTDDFFIFYDEYSNRIDTNPILVDRKKYILNRINELTINEKIKNVKNLSMQLNDKNIESKITIELISLQEEELRHKMELKKITDIETEAKIKLEQQRIDGLERKSKIWLSFLQRESAASIIGGLVLLMLTLALIGGMIFGRESQILSNGFLVILGYFFGQSSVKNNKDGSSDSM